MSIQLPNSFIALFDAEVKQAYQQGSKLLDTVRRRSGVNSSTYRFPKMGKGMAQRRIFQTDVTPMNVGHSGAVVNLSSWVAPEYTDIFAQAQVNFDEKRELVMAVSMALGRTIDQLVISEALDQAALNTVGQNVGGNNSGLNLEKLLNTKELMDTNGVPEGDRHIALSPRALRNMLSLTQVTSSDFVTVKALVQGDIDTYLGFKFHMIESRAEGGLPFNTNTNVRTCYAWHKDSVGYAEGIPQSTEINYVPEKTSWLVAGKLLAGAINIEDEGIVKIQVNEA